MGIAIFVLTTIALLMSTLVVTDHFNAGFHEVFPVSTGIMILILYVLAFFRGMDLVVVISGIIVVFSTFYFYKNPKAILQWKVVDILSLLVLVIVAILTSKRVFTWWDDINFWATDVKALYFLNGFPSKYGNVAPEFGDYPPGTQMMKWLFLKLSDTYQEGLAFSGYYTMIIIFLFPVLGGVRKKSKLIQSISLFILCFVPGICNSIWSQGTAADIVMAVVYGSLLIAIVDYEDQNRIFYYVRIAVFASILCLCKSTGFEWALFAVAFYLIFQKHIKKERYWFISILIPLLVESGWLFFCYSNRRIAKLTSSGVNILKGGHFVFPSYIGERVKLFFKGFALCPMNIERTNLLNLSSLSFVIILFFLIIFLGKKQVFDSFERKLILIFLTATCLLSYGIVLLGHVTIFSMETQYDTAEVITISFSRYCSPFTIGMIMLLLFYILKRVNDNKFLILTAIFVLISTNYTAYYDSLFGYHSVVENDIQSRDEVLTEYSKEYVDRVCRDQKLWGHRVLLLRDYSQEHRILDTFTNYYASPTPTVYADFDMESARAEDLIQLINTNHASFLYVEPQESKSFEEISSLMANSEFRYATIYEIETKGNEVKLKEVLF